MKTLTLIIATGIFLVAFGARAGAWSGSDPSFHEGYAIDPSAHAMVQINSPNLSSVTASNERIYLDSNGVFAVNELNGSTFSGIRKEQGPMYCFDSTQKFCALSN